MTKFGRHPELSTRTLAAQAVSEALVDAALETGDIQAAYVANSVEGLLTGQESIRGQVALRDTGLLGIPIFNVENACASGSTAFHLAWQAINGGTLDCVLVVGFEKLVMRDKERVFRAFDSTMDLTEMRSRYPAPSSERSIYMDHYAESVRPADGTMLLARIAAKNHRHGSLNPLAQFQHPYTAEQVLASRTIIGPLTLFMCAPLSDGAAAVLLVSERFARQRGAKGVSVAASVLVTGTGEVQGARAVPRAVQAAYESAGLGPTDLDLVELHDATALAECDLYSDIGLCERGEEGRILDSGEAELGGKRPINPSGGLIARGHPIGATGVAQIVEVTNQLRGRCGDRQVGHARTGLTQNVGGVLGNDVASATAHIFRV
ncbi:MAG: thiolase family protein [Acidimicrobiaceae bacterium]|nr:thiolase family protein [Acidimicrobiaceae bacterium]